MQILTLSCSPVKLNTKNLYRNPCDFLRSFSEISSFLFLISNLFLIFKISIKMKIYQLRLGHNFSFSSDYSWNFLCHLKIHTQTHSKSTYNFLHFHSQVWSQCFSNCSFLIDSSATDYISFAICLFFSAILDVTIIIIYFIFSASLLINTVFSIQYCQYFSLRLFTPLIDDYSIGAFPS